MKCERAYAPSELAHVFGDYYRCLDRAKCASVRVEALQRRGDFIPSDLVKEANGQAVKVRPNFFESLQQMPEPLAAPAFNQAKPAKKPQAPPWKKPAPVEELGIEVSSDLLRGVDEMFGEVFGEKGQSEEESEPVQVAAKAFVDGDEITSESPAYQEATPIRLQGAKTTKPARAAPATKAISKPKAAKPKKAETKAATAPKKRGPKERTMLPQGKVRIVERTTRLGKTYRQLECGHEQKEPTGGKAHLAQSAYCQICIQSPKSTASGEAA